MLQLMRHLLNRILPGRPPSSELRCQILRFTLSISAYASLLVSLINIFNGRPLSNILLPLGLGLFLLGLRRLSDSEAHYYGVKLTFMVMISVIYVPVAWITSPGSSSAMPMYTLLILTVTVLLIERAAEFLIPALLALEVLALLRYEALYPDRFLPYTDRFYHAFDLSVNFTAIAVILTLLLVIVNRYFAEERQLLYQLSVTDQLTGTYNRRYLYPRLQEIHSFSRRYHQPYSLIMIDINHFKQINDTYCHPAGDEVLRQTGACLKRTCRSFDVIVRYGGDEFLVILPNTSAALAEVLSRRISAEFVPLAAQYPAVPLDLAIGTAESAGDDLEALLQLVDDRLYLRKREMK